jgi:citrate lyase subunit beta/citryl-CoA lyase
MRRRRSALFVPASNVRALQKAPSLEADVVIFDLEDSVAPEQKATARSNLALAPGGSKKAEMVIRINGPDTEWTAADVAFAARSGTDAILVPKVRHLADLERISDLVDVLGPQVELWAMIEDPLAFFNLREICEGGCHLAHPLTCLVVGSNDLALQTGVSNRNYMTPWFMQVVLAAKAWRLGVLDGVRNDFADVEGLRSECNQGAHMGFDGKTLIHPSQISIANASFSPSAETIAWAQKVIAAFSAEPNKGVIAVDGIMVEQLHLIQAQRTMLMAP